MSRKPIDYVWGLAGVLVVVVVVLVIYKIIIPVGFEFWFGDHVRDIVREMVKPEALK